MTPKQKNILQAFDDYMNDNSLPNASYFSHRPDLEKFIARFCSSIPFFIYRHALKDSSLGIPLFPSNQIHLDFIF